MENNKLTNIVKNKKLLMVTLVTFVIFSAWWASIQVRGHKNDSENQAFTTAYVVIAFWGGVWGLYVAKKWGGLKSILGRAFDAFSVGLLCQAIGTVCYSYYIIILKVEVPYPSIGDVAFFATGIFYAYGAVQLMRALGVNFGLKSYRGKASAILIPVLWAVFSYVFFLRGYAFDWQQPVTIFLDLISPLIDGVYISLIILVFLLSRRFLGGAMKYPILLLMVAVFGQAVADYIFIYQTSRDLVYAAGPSDFIYMTAYTLMAIALIQLGSAFNKLTEQTP